MYTIVTKYGSIEVSISCLQPDSTVSDLLSFLPTREILCDESGDIIYEDSEYLSSGNIPEDIYTLDVTEKIRKEPEFFKTFYKNVKCHCEEHLILAFNTILFPGFYMTWVKRYVEKKEFENMYKIKSLLDLVEIKKDYLYDKDFIIRMSYSQWSKYSDMIYEVYHDKVEELTQICKLRNMFPFLKDPLRQNLELNLNLIKNSVFPLYSLCSCDMFTETLCLSDIKFNIRDIETLNPSVFEKCIPYALGKGKIHYTDIFLIPERMRSKLYYKWLSSEQSNGILITYIKKINTELINTVLDNPESNGMYVIMKLYKTIDQTPELFFKAVKTNKFEWIPFHGQKKILSNIIFVDALLKTKSSEKVLQSLREEKLINL